MKCPYTYKQIAAYVKKNNGYAIHTCVIACVLRELGYDVGRAHNSGTSKKPKKPTERDLKAIREAITDLNK